MLIFAHVHHPLDIWKNNLNAEMDKDDCKSIAVTHNLAKVCSTATNQNSDISRG